MRKHILSKKAQRVRASWPYQGAYTRFDRQRADWTPAEIAYHVARREHAFLLRCEGMKFKEIAARLGVTTSTAANCVARHGLRMAKAMKRTKVRIT